VNSFHTFKQTLVCLRQGRLFPSHPRGRVKSEGLTASSVVASSSSTASRFEDFLLAEWSQPEAYYNSLLGIGFTTESRSFFFSEDVDRNHSICSAVAIFNMALVLQNMENEDAARLNLSHGRPRKLKSLYKLCVELIKNVREDDQNTNCTACAVCDLIAMASLNNLIQLSTENQMQNVNEQAACVSLLLWFIQGIILHSPYEGNPEVAAPMENLANKFLVNAYCAVAIPMAKGAAPAA